MVTRAVPLQGRLEKCGRTSKGGSPESVDRIRQIYELARSGLPEYTQYSGNRESSFRCKKQPLCDVALPFKNSLLC
jgi:hypothetical protein